jgi:nitroreductase
MIRDALEVIRTRRVVRAMSDDPVPRDRLEHILDAAAHAPSAGNRRLHRFVVVDDPPTLRVIRMVSPGMLQHPAAAIVICIDAARATGYGFKENSSGLYVDVGTTAQTMLLAAHALGVGSGPVTSFSKAAVSVVLNLPARMEAGYDHLPRVRSHQPAALDEVAKPAILAGFDALGSL